jgi:hypothetical protein
MESRIERIVLIGNRRNAALALCSTGLVATQSFRAAFSHGVRNPHWMISLEPIALPTWLLAAVNASFFLYLVWVIVTFFRNAVREERLVFAGWLGVFLLIPLQQLVSPRAATAIQWVKASGMAVAFIAAAYILVKSPPNTGGIAKENKQRLLVFVFLLFGLFALGALIYFIPN